MHRMQMIALMLVAACLAIPADASELAPPTTATLRSMIDSYSEQSRVEGEVRAKDRAEMVRPAPRDFKPETKGRRLSVIFVPRSAKLKVRETLWYRLEIKNLGSETVTFWESPSFLKYGTFWDDGKWKFIVVTPSGARRRIPLHRYGDARDAGRRRARGILIPGSERMTKEELTRQFEIERARNRADKGLSVELAPGETLVSRAWRWITDEVYAERLARNESDLYPRPPGAFRELWTDFKFHEAGRYSIQVEYDDSPLGPPDEDFLRRMELKGHSRKEVIRRRAERESRRLGRVESAPVEIEVVQ